MIKREIIKCKILLRCVAIASVMLVATASLPLALAQTPLDELLEEQVEQQLESELAERLERAVEEQVEADVGEAIEQQVEADVGEAIEQQVETSVLEAVEQEVEATMLGTVEQHVESGVLEAVEQQIESGVLDAVQGKVESGVLDAVEQQVETAVLEAVDQQVETVVLEAVDQQVETDVLETIEQQLGSAMPERVTRQIEMLIEAVASGALELPLADDVLEDLEEALEPTLVELLREALAQVNATQATENSGAGEEDAAADSQEVFLAGLDDLGQRIERDVWVILVEPENAERIDDWGFDVRERQTLQGLDLILLRVTAPTARTLAEAALELALDSPGTVVDLNHLYVTSDDQAAGGEGSAAMTGAPAPPAGRTAPSIAPTGVARQPSGLASGRPAVGILDTSVAVEHEALTDADIVQRDLVPFDARRPAAHGTAVASILVGDSPAVEAQMVGGRLYAASVFLEDEEGEPAAVTSSLVRGLSWLTEEGVSVVNMSLAGPPNRVLEAAVERAAARGAILVAAVGNNGPVGEPLYPAAYGAVLGITAVDSRDRIYRYANRGPHVAFAAPGVRIPVALDTGGYGTESGTSMAAPHAAAVIARSLAATGKPPRDVLMALEAPSVALGRRLRDDVFGYGVIAPVE